MFPRTPPPSKHRLSLPLQGSIRLLAGVLGLPALLLGLLHISLASTPQVAVASGYPEKPFSSDPEPPDQAVQPFDPETSQAIPPITTYPFAIWELEKFVTGVSFQDPLDEFGASVSISQDTIVVGAPSDNISLVNKTGFIYIYFLNEGGIGNWGMVGSRLKGNDSQHLGKFGFSVSIDGDTIVSGAPDQNIDRGVAYVFQRDQGGNWSQAKKLTAESPLANDHFGYAVAINGDTILAGAPDKNNSSGSAFVFSRNQGGTGNWGRTKTLTTTLPLSSLDQFGFSVAVNGDIAVVGAPGDSSSTGAAYIFSRDQGGTDNWGQVQKLVPGAGGEPDDKFGLSVSIDGTTLVIGAAEDNDDVFNTDDVGSAYVFEPAGGNLNNWAKVKKIIPGDGALSDKFGTSVAISGSAIIVGSQLKTEQGNSSGAVYVFLRNEGGSNNWGELTKFVGGDTGQGDFFGTSVDISGSRMVIGAPFHKIQEYHGAAYLFGNNGVLYLPIITR